jgi:hypothetical protein
MSGIVKDTWREQQIHVTAGVVKEVFFSDTQPTVIQVINNSNTQNLYVHTKPSVNDSLFELSIIPSARKVLTKPQGIKYIYLFCLSDTDVLINSGEGEIYPSDLNEASDVIIKSNIATNIEISKINQALPTGDNNIGNVDIVSLPALPSGNNNIGVVKTNNADNYTPVKVVLVAGIDNVIKNISGYVICIKTDLTDLIVKDGITEVYSGNYSGLPMVFNTSIILNSATGGNAYIVYK